ncbi:MAG: hypothetical protein Q4P15_08610 [Propionibacteriaceae bacterium]|nr:hypothetical protein [Propionibacteriaceae bacterium]
MNKKSSLGALAPNVDEQWRDDFVVELRLQGASGTAIADALVEVDAHCKESGQGVPEAFGSAVEYARALDLPDESRWTAPKLMSTWVSLLLLAMGAWLMIDGGTSLALGQDVEITLGSLISAVATLVVMALIFVFGDPLVRFLFHHVVLAGVCFMATLAALVGIGMLFSGTALGSIPAFPALIAGIAALVAFGVFALIRRWTGTTLDDPLVPPSAATPHPSAPRDGQ